MKTEKFVERIGGLGIRLITGVPDSTLKEFCSYVSQGMGSGITHMTVPNEGSAVGIAIGEYLSAGRPTCVYMQNSGLGNVVNPVTSLANREVYGIPMLFVLGWRGEPGICDEPQHRFMGKATLGMLNVLGIDYAIIGKETEDKEMDAIFRAARENLEEGRQYAIVVRKDTLEGFKATYRNAHSLVREEAIRILLCSIGKADAVVSTTGKISREVYEQGDALLGQHSQTFLTVGGMGHASMIALGIARNRKGSRVFCIDGDGAVLMHMGALAFIGAQAPENLVHVCLNNGAHESVGGMPTGAGGQEYYRVAKACGYRAAFCARTEGELTAFMKNMPKEGPIFLEVMVSMASRADLGRPRESACENKKKFMAYHGVAAQKTGDMQ